MFRSLSLLLFSLSVLSAEDLRFNRDIRPILSENCFFCHGQDPKHREADLRLDQRSEAIKDNDGVFAIVPGHPEKSEILKRLLSHDADDQMPPPESNRKVSRRRSTSSAAGLPRARPTRSIGRSCRPRKPRRRSSAIPPGPVSLLTVMSWQNSRPRNSSLPPKPSRRPGFAAPPST